VTEGASSTLIQRVGESWGSAFRDMVLIVASILIAFSLEAWWDSHRTLADERAALSAVRDDFRAARRELDTVLVRNEKVLEAVGVVLAMNPEDVAKLDSDSAQALMRYAYGGGLTFDPPTGALQALLYAGTLGDIRNHTLAADLSAWPGLMDEIDEDQVFIIDSFNRLQEIRVHTGTLEQSLILRGLLPGPAEMTIGEILAALLSESKDRETLARHMLSVTGLLMELEDVDRRLDALLEQLDAELGDPVSDDSPG
jgi:hypothetical protein